MGRLAKARKFKGWVGGLLLSTFPSTLPVMAQQLAVPVDPRSTLPADDLSDGGRTLSREQASRLREQGRDLSLFNPSESLFWSTTPEAKVCPDAVCDAAEGATKDSPVVIEYKDGLSSPRGLYRSLGAIGGDRVAFVLTLDLNRALLRAHLLTRLGFRMPGLALAKFATIQFPTIESKNKYLENLETGALVSSSRFLLDEKRGTLDILVRGVLIFKAQIETTPFFWGYFDRLRVQTHRAVRAAVIFSQWMDVPEKVNELTYRFEERKLSALYFEVPDAEEFKDAIGMEDLQWAGRRMARLTREDLKAGLRYANFPEPVVNLYAEKLLERRNQFLKSLSLEAALMAGLETPDLNISDGPVVDGVLVREIDREDYVWDFWSDPKKSPFRASQIFRYFSSEVVFSGLRLLVDQFNAQIPTLSEVLDGEFIQRSILKPSGTVSLLATRSVAFGTVFGNEARIQLVDAFGAQASVGVNAAIPGLGLPVTGGASIMVGRNYAHLRPLENLSEALKVPIREIPVSREMRRLSRILKPDALCEISKVPYIEEEILSVGVIKKVIYDETRPTAREEALKLRAKLISEGVPEGKILLVPEDRSKACEEVLAAASQRELEIFLDEFAEGEAFMISDQLIGNSQLGVRATLPALPLVSATGGVAANRGLVRVTQFKRNKDTFEVLTQEIGSEGITGLFTGNVVAEILRLSHERSKGDAHNLFYKIDWESADAAGRRKAMRAFRGLFKSHSVDWIKREFSGYPLEHEARTRFNRSRFLWFQKDSVKVSHEVSLAKPEVSNSERKFITAAHVRRKGKNIRGWLERLFPAAVRSFLPVSPTGGASIADPANSVLGSSEKQVLTAIAEWKDGRLRGTSLVLEDSYQGWEMSGKKFRRLIHGIELRWAYLRNPREWFPESAIAHTDKLQGYRISGIFNIDSAAVERMNIVHEAVAKLGPLNRIKVLAAWMESGEYLRQCEALESRNGSISHRLRVDARGGSVCELPWMKEFAKDWSTFLSPQDPKSVGIQLSRFESLVESVDLGKWIDNLGSDGIFISYRATGFRKGDPNGYWDYESDIFGRVRNETVSGETGRDPLSEISGFTGIPIYELIGKFFYDNL